MKTKTIEQLAGLQVALNEGEENLSPVALRTIVSKGREISAALNGLDWLNEPLKSTFKSIKDQIDTALSNIPITDAVPAAGRANAILYDLANVMSHTQILIDHISKKPQATLNAAALDEIAAPKIEAALNAKIASGDYVAKKDHEAALNSAKEKAVNDAKAEWQTALNRVADRRKVLATEKLPEPDAAILETAKDEDWNASLKEAKERNTKLVALDKLPEGTLAAERMKALVWGSDKPGFDMNFGILETLNKQVATNSHRRPGPLPIGAGKDPKEAPAAPRKHRFVA